MSAEHGTRPGKLSHNELENHIFSWENSLFLWQCSIAMLVYQRVKFAFGDVFKKCENLEIGVFPGSVLL
jgi:hypothetical protein